MKGVIRGLIIGGVIIAVGIAIILITLGVNGWSIENMKFTANTFTAEGDCTSLEAGIDAGTLKTEFYDGDKVIIDYPTADGLEARVIEENGKIIFVSDLKWYKSFFSFRRIPDTVIKLPKGAIIDVSFKMNAGTIELADGTYTNVNIDINAGTFNANSISCDTFVCDMSAGTMLVNRLTCAKTKIDMSAGTVKLSMSGGQNEYAIHTKVSAGSCNVSSQPGETDKRIDIDISAGTAKINFGA